MRSFLVHPSAPAWALLLAATVGCDLWLVEPAAPPSAIEVSFALTPASGTATAAETGDNLLVRLESDGHERLRRVVDLDQDASEVRLRLDAPFEGEESTVRVDAILRSGEEPLLEAVSLISVRRGESHRHEMTLRDLPRFPDPALEAALRGAIGRPSGPLATLDFRPLAIFEAREAGIVDLEGLQHLIHLHRIDLGGNAVADLAPLSALVDLNALGLQFNRVTSLAPLAGLIRLENLDIVGNDVEDLSPLAGMRELGQLHIGRNRVASLAPIAGFDRLGWLAASNNLISDLSPLAGLASLEIVHLQSNRISDLSPLGGLEELRVLHVSGNEVEALTPLAGLTGLASLSAEHNRIRDISGLATATGLREISLVQNEITDLQALVDNPGLGPGAEVRVGVNPLSPKACSQDIPALQARGVIVDFLPSCLD